MDIKTLDKKIEEARERGKKIAKILDRGDGAYTDDELETLVCYYATIGSAESGMTAIGANSMFQSLETIANFRRR